MRRVGQIRVDREYEVGEVVYLADGHSAVVVRCVKQGNRIYIVVEVKP